MVEQAGEPVLSGENGVARVIGIIGEEWSLAILREATLGVRRFGDFKENLGIANSVLSSRLKLLVEAKVLDRVPYQQRPFREEYHLSASGRDLWRVLLTIWSWEISWTKDDIPAVPIAHHKGCDEELRPVLACGSCNAAVQASDISGRFGPSGDFERSVPRVSTRRRSNKGQSQDAPFSETVALIGNRWSATLLAAAFFGARRFNEFAQQLSAPPTIVSERLKVFCELGVLKQVQAGPTGSRSSYQLTNKGRAFFPLMMTATAWGDKWFRAEDGPTMYFRHKTCGSRFTPVLLCGSCGTRLRRNDIVIADRVVGVVSSA